MVVDYGVTVPEGRLPVFSVDTEEEAEALLIAACQTDPSGQYIAKELYAEQTLENLNTFSSRLAVYWFDLMTKEPERAARGLVTSDD